MTFGSCPEKWSVTGKGLQNYIFYALFIGMLYLMRDGSFLFWLSTSIDGIICNSYNMAGQ
jgi:hypothetical protein